MIKKTDGLIKILEETIVLLQEMKNEIESNSLDNIRNNIEIYDKLKNQIELNPRANRDRLAVIIAKRGEFVQELRNLIIDKVLEE